MSPEEFNATFPVSVLSAVKIGLPYVFNLAVGVFLLSEAKRNKLNSVFWFFLGAVFSFNAILLFYIFQLFKLPRLDKKDMLD